MVTATVLSEGAVSAVGYRCEPGPAARRAGGNRGG